MSTSTFFTETYGGFRIYFLNDLNGKELLNRLWSNDLFLNIYDYWSIHRHGYLLGNYLERNKMLKKIIRQKLSGDPNLPTYKVFLRMCANGRADFNPSDFLEKDWGEYFEQLRIWKIVNEEEFLKTRPHLREPKRQLKSKIIVIN